MKVEAFEGALEKIFIGDPMLGHASLARLGPYRDCTLGG